MKNEEEKTRIYNEHFVPLYNMSNYIVAEEVARKNNLGKFLRKEEISMIREQTKNNAIDKVIEHSNNPNKISVNDIKEAIEVIRYWTGVKKSLNN